ncbi:Innexin [Aphelenchoides besseyi]|nr:Innexin [Aphelenchoides besseyi]
MVLQHMFGALSFLQYRADDDIIGFGGRPLECWVPAQFTASWEAYAEIYCWAKNTYWVPFSEDIPIDIADREYHQISYYQWVPFFLLCEAVLFYIPAMLWRALGSKSGIRLNDIVQMATEKENIEPEYRLRTIESLARHIEAALRYQHAATSRSQYTLHRVFKCFNLRVTLCDFEVRVLGNNQRHSVQCVLVINIFNEKIFVLLWLWFSILFVLATLDGLYWFSISLFHRDRLRFILRHLELTSDPDRPELFRKENRKQVEHFLRTYVKVDGVLILRMIALHAGVMYCTEITDALWKRYLSQHPENLIDEDSSLLHFARSYSRSRHVVGDKSGSSGSLQPNHNSGQHQRLSRFLSYRQSGSFRNNRQSGSRSLPKKGAETSRTPSPKEGHMIGATQPSQTTVISITPSSRPGSRSSGITSGRLKTLSSSTSSPFDGEMKSKTKFLRRLRLTGSEDKGKQNETTVLL